MKIEIRIRFRSFVDPLYRDTTVSRYLSYKSLKAYATIPNGFIAPAGFLAPEGQKPEEAP